MNMTYRYLKALPEPAVRLLETLADAVVTFRQKELDGRASGSLPGESIYGTSVLCYRDAITMLGLCYGEPVKVKRYLAWRCREARVTL